jgi:hypothetical protein
MNTPPGAWPANPPGTAPAPPPGAPSGAPPPWQPPPRTSGLAIGSLIAGCAQWVVWPVAPIAAITAIVLGHIARHRVRRTGEQGAGLALAGLILGYVGLALAALALTGVLVFVFALSPGIAQREARSDAAAFGSAIIVEASLQSGSPRDPLLIRDVYYRETDYRGCCVDSRIRLADGTRVEYAARQDYARVDWKLEVSNQVVYRKYACLYLPETGAATGIWLTDGRCGP